MRARGDGDFRRKTTEGLITEGTEDLNVKDKKEKTSASSVASPRLSIPIRESNGGATFSVRVQPRAKRNAVTGVMGDALKLTLTAPPVEGKANQACIKFLADLLDVPRSSITIAAGETSRNKLIRVSGLTAAQVTERLRAGME